MAFYLLYQQPGGTVLDICPSKDYPLSKATEVYLACSPSTKTVIHEVKLLFRSGVGVGFTIIAGTAGETENLTLQAL